jgi:hypothetical protein
MAAGSKATSVVIASVGRSGVAIGGLHAVSINSQTMERGERGVMNALL